MARKTLFLAIGLALPLMFAAGCGGGLTAGLSATPVPAVARGDWARILQEAESLWADMPPADAPFVSVTVKWKEPENEDYPRREFRGWLVGQSDKEYVVRTPFGQEERISKELPPDPDQRYAREDYRSGRWGGYAQPPIVKEVPIAEVVAQLVNWQQTGEPPILYWDLFRGLSLRTVTAETQTYATLLAAWLDKAHRPALRDKVLASALATFNEKELVAAMRKSFGDTYGYPMLVAFVGDRDYDRTLALAARIPPGKTMFGFYAERFLGEIPKRRDDFRTLILPSYGEWIKIKAGLDHAGQVRYLCDRMRLLNCFQLEQPGTLDITWRQYRGPSGMTSDAAWSKREKGVIILELPTQPDDVVINPYVELTGKQSEIAARVFPPAAPLTLTAADVGLIAPYLKQNWSILAIAFPRDFMEDRGLYDTDYVFCKIINDLAGEELCNARTDEWKNEKGRDALIERLKSWAKEHASPSK